MSGKKIVVNGVRVKCMVCGKICTPKEAINHEHNLWELVSPPIKESNMKEQIKWMAHERKFEELENIRILLNELLDGKCTKCGRILAVTQKLDSVNLPEGRTCMPCMGGS